MVRRQCARLAVAEESRPVPGLDIGNHAAADASGCRPGALSSISSALSDGREAGFGAGIVGIGGVERPGILPPCADVACGREGRGARTNGRFPETAEVLRELPGIGRYTSAAIASIAFGEAVAVVDGNVERVLQRVSGQRLSQADVWRAADELLDRHRAGDFNQAMMELGAVVCTPRVPACLTCPVVELCATRGEMDGGEKSSPQTKREVHYALECHNGKVLLVQRPPDASLMAGMWELPELAGVMPRSGAKQIPHLATNDYVKRSQSAKGNGQLKVRDRSQRSGKVHALLFSVKHSITVTDYTVRVWDASSKSARGEWIAVNRLNRVALTGLARKILRKAEILASHNRQG